VMEQDKDGQMDSELQTADRRMMEVFARADIGSRPPRWTHDEPAAAIFTGTPSHVANYLAAHMPKQPNRVALLTAELTHLALC
jgi:hypothetical protein